MNRTTGWLRVRTVRLLGGAEPPKVARVVWCPTSERSKSLDECLVCEDCEGVSGDPDGQRSLVLCRHRRDLVNPLEVRATDAASTPIADILRRETLCIRPETSVESLAQLFFDRGISGAPVVDADGKPLGVVSRSDLLEAMREPKDVEVGTLSPGFHEEREPETARDVMTASPITILESEMVSHAAAVMSFEGVHRLPVVDGDGRVVGLISALDVLRWLARHDGFHVPDYTQKQR